MRLDDCYHTLDLRAGASDEEVKRAHRDLVKVWHPDRFGSDQALRRKAEEKLKLVNEAYETILAAREGAASGRRRAPDGPEAAAGSGPGESAGPHQQLARNRTWALLCAGAAVFLLLRRPTSGGLLFALLLFCAAFAFLMRMRAARRP